MRKHQTPSDLDGFGFLLSDTSRLLRRRFEQKAAEYRLTTAQWRAIGQLARHDGQTQVALAANLDIEPMTVCRLVDRMEAAGFVRRRPDPSDKRAKLVFLTERARELFDVMQDIALEVYTEAFAGFDETQRLALVNALRRINANLLTQLSIPEDISA